MIRTAFAFLLLATPAFADEPPPPRAAPKDELVTVQSFGRAHPDCVEWSDACIVCTRAGCSTPGIACTPTPPVCRR